MAAGVYRVRVRSGNLGSVSGDATDGDDRYSVTFWPGNPSDPFVHKLWSQPGEST